MLLYYSLKNLNARQANNKIKLSCKGSLTQKNCMHVHKKLYFTQVRFHWIENEFFKFFSHSYQHLNYLTRIKKGIAMILAINKQNNCQEIDININRVEMFESG